MTAARSTATRLTARGRGAVATVQVRGDLTLLRANEHFRAANGKAIHEQEIGRVCFGHWGRVATEEVVVCRVDSNTAEIHCHGGDAAVQRILDDLTESGYRIQSWHETLADADGLLASECAHTLAHATTVKTAGYLLQQQSGVLKAAFDDLLNTCLPADGNAGVPPCNSARFRRVLLEKLEALLRWADFGLHLTQPWDVVIAGRPNVGKSSLMNALVGYSRAIVYDQPGTTRDVVTADTVFDGWPIRFADTAGLRETPDALEQAGIEYAQHHLEAADAIILVLDMSEPITTMDQELLDKWSDAVAVANKSDLPNKARDEMPSTALSVSSLTGDGLDSLIQTVLQRLIPSSPESRMAVPITKRQVSCLEDARTAAQANDIAACRAALLALTTGDNATM